MLVVDGKHGPRGAEAAAALPAGRSAVPDSWLAAPPPTAHVVAASRRSNPISRAELHSAARTLSSSPWASSDFWPKTRARALVAIGLYPPLRAADATVHEQQSHTPQLANSSTADD